MKTNEWKREFYTFGTILFILFQGYKYSKKFSNKKFRILSFSRIEKSSISDENFSEYQN